MRLTCPNCGAQYEVPEDVIPQSGRDVQCSNCGDTWFQHHRDHTPEDERDEAADATLTWDTPEPEPADDPDSARTDADSPADADTDPAPQGEPSHALKPQSEAPAPDPAQRRELDPDVANVLREEAAREARARAQDTGSGLESQPELGLDAVDDGNERRAREAHARMAKLRGEPTEIELAAIDPTSRRSLLPDIEEINSSLRSGEDEEDTAPTEDAYADDGQIQPRKGGFRRGFLMMVTLAVLLTLVYVFAPQIARMVPVLGDVLSDYVAMVNALRQSLNGKVAALMAWFDIMASGQTGS